MPTKQCVRIRLQPINQLSLANSKPMNNRRIGSPIWSPRLFLPMTLPSALWISAPAAGGWRCIFRAAPDKKTIRALTAQPRGALPPKRCASSALRRRIGCAKSLAPDWPRHAGRFIVHGAHDRVRIPFNHIGIEIEAALAFGTGHHGTTRGLPARARNASANHAVAKTIRRILDLGTGSGVLGYLPLRARCGSPCSQTDIDGVAVRAARANAALNRAAVSSRW